jgi:hypothetical protein
MVKRSKLVALGALGPGTGVPAPLDLLQFQKRPNRANPRFGALQIIASAVSIKEAIDAAFCRAVRVTLVGSTTPALPKPGAFTAQAFRVPRSLLTPAWRSPFVIARLACAGERDAPLQMPWMSGDVYVRHLQE